MKRVLLALLPDPPTLSGLIDLAWGGSDIEVGVEGGADDVAGLRLLASELRYSGVSAGGAFALTGKAGKLGSRLAGGSWGSWGSWLN